MEQNSNQTNSPETPVPVPTPVSTSAPVEAVDNSLLMGILAYLGILVIIPYLMAKDQPFVRYHIKQGIVLCGLWLLVYIVGTTILPYGLYQILQLFNLAIVALAIFGIVHVVQKKEEPLPIIGHLADKISI